MLDMLLQGSKVEIPFFFSYSCLCRFVGRIQRLCFVCFTISPSKKARQQYVSASCLLTDWEVRDVHRY